MKNNKHVEYIGGGIQCDNPQCDYNEPSVEASHYKEWLNKPCPKCGENLLTEEDLKNHERLITGVELINSLSEEQLKMFNNMFSQLNNPQLEELKLKMEPSTDGSVTISVRSVNGKMDFDINPTKE